MSKKIYTEAQMRDAVHNAAVEARHKQIGRSATVMQEYVNKNDALILDLAEKEIVIQNLLGRVEVNNSELDTIRRQMANLENDLRISRNDLSTAETYNIELKAGYDSVHEENSRLREENNILNEENQRIIAEKEELLNTNHKLRAGRA